MRLTLFLALHHPVIASSRVRSYPLASVRLSESRYFWSLMFPFMRESKMSLLHDVLELTWNKWSRAAFLIYARIRYGRCVTHQVLSLNPVQHNGSGHRHESYLQCMELSNLVQFRLCRKKNARYLINNAQCKVHSTKFVWLKLTLDRIGAQRIWRSHDLRAQSTARSIRSYWKEWTWPKDTEGTMQ
jgi:hypothetical protein